MPEVITNNLDLWSSALLTKSTAGRDGNGKLETYGIKKLRELILELAVRGKLVPQDANDEPASVLLERIEKEKARLVMEGKFGAQKPLPDVAKDDKHFGLPNGWTWTRLGEVTNYGVTYKAEPEDVNEDTWVLDLEDVEKETSRLLTKNRFAEKPFRSSKNRFSSGDVIYGKLRPYLDKVLVADEDGVCTTEMVPVRGFGGIYPFYLRLVMKTPYFIKYADDSTHGMNLPRLGTDKARMAVFPLAPLAEQHRIVAKVDELMALCDQLEKQQTLSLAAHQTLVETLLGTLTRVASPQEFTEGWSRIANHFDTLFTTDQSLDQLKQTILQLAVMGKLVPQDPNEKPVRDLFESIVREKKRLVDEGVLRKQEPLPEIREAEMPFSLASGWIYVRLGDISKLITKGSSPKWQGISYTEDPSDVLFITSENVGSYILLLDNKKYVEKKFNEVEPRSVLNDGDFLMNIVGASIGRTAIFDIDAVANINQAVCLIRVFADKLDSKFLLLFFNSATCVSYMFDKQVDNARANLSMGNIAKFVVPLPPLEEQHRIVAKVDELMALCDALKARLADAQTTQLHLADAIVERAVA